MISKLRPLLTMLFAAGYLAQSLVLGVVHLHTANSSRCNGRIGGCAPVETGAVETCAAAARLCGHGDSGDGCHESHDHPPTDNREDTDSGGSPTHDHDTCSICRHLVEKTISADLACLPLTGEAVEPIKVAQPTCYPVPLPRTHFSRGPPAECC